MDTSHALFETYRIPGDIVVDHEPAELQVDTFSCCLCSNHYLAGFLELPLGVKACSNLISITDLHTAVDLGNAQTPLAQLSVRSAILSVTGQVIQCILMLGKEQQFHVGVAKDALFCEDLL